MLYIENIPAKPQEQKTIRVAAYARVSSDKDAAFHSLEAQTDYYEGYVAAHPNWELVGIYSDNGISGTIINRPEFQHMLEDCRAGKVDLVVSKSITRFARNTVILLETVRELKQLGIDCYFEKENLHSISPDGELLLTLLAMYAEEEARSASENQKWRIQKLYEQGKPAGGHAYGYRLLDGKFEIIPAEADVVREVYRLYLSGLGYGRISAFLIAHEIPAPFGGKWSPTSVRDILTNEKYVGDLLLQKNYREDFRSKKLRHNTGERRKVYVKNSHDPIIDRMTFNAVQQELARRSEVHNKAMANRNMAHDNSNQLFRGLITCGYCGSAFIRKYTNAKKYDKAIWICSEYYKVGKVACLSQQIPESILIEKTTELLGVADLSRDLVRERISHIRVPEHNHLIYELADGTKIDVFWQHLSRSLSWTPEMRQRAREKALKKREEGGKEP